jgi:hypothetical protein
MWNFIVCVSFSNNNWNFYCDVELQHISTSNVNNSRKPLQFITIEQIVVMMHKTLERRNIYLLLDGKYGCSYYLNKILVLQWNSNWTFD